MSRWGLYWRISSTSAGLATGHLFARHIPPPTTSRYRTFTIKNPQSKGGVTRQGYTNITLLWNELDGLQFKALNDIVEAALTAGSCYLTCDKANGTGIVDAFVDVHGAAQPLNFEEVPRVEGRVFQAVELIVNDLTVDSDPSTVF